MRESAVNAPPEQGVANTQPERLHKQSVVFLAMARRGFLPRGLIGTTTTRKRDRAMKTTTLAALAFGLTLVGAPAFAADYDQNRGRDNQPAADEQDQNQQGERDRDRRGNKGDKGDKPGGMQKSGDDTGDRNYRNNNDNDRNRGYQRTRDYDQTRDRHNDDNNTTYRDRDRRYDNWSGDRRRVNRDWSQYRRNFKAQRRFRIGIYHAPRGYYYRRWHYGERLPIAFYARDYWLLDFIAYGLFAPPPGCVWVRYGDDALLIDTYTGEIIQVRYDVFYS